MKRTVCVVITARPSYSRIKTALTAIGKHPDLELRLVVAASALLDRYGNAIGTIVKDGFPIAAQVHMVLAGEKLVTFAHELDDPARHEPCYLHHAQKRTIIAFEG